MVAVTCVYQRLRRKIYTFDLPSRTRLGPLIVPDREPITQIWTHDKYLRFATINRGSITIQQVEFTLIHPPTQVESFSIPNEVIGGDEFLFFPALSRLTFTLKDTIQVWDVKASKLLLKLGAMQSLGYSSAYSSSSDSQFFAFATDAREVHVWKESPTGYMLHQQSPPLLNILQWLHLSPNGGSIVFPLHDTINLWHTRDQILSSPTPPTEEHSEQHFILTFSPDEKSVAFAQAAGKVVTILDLKSGNLQLTIDTGMQVKCLGVAGDTVIVIDMEKIVTWNLPGGDCVFSASINDSIQTVMLDFSQLPLCLAEHSIQSLSPDLSCLAVQGEYEQGPGPLEIYDVATGTCLASYLACKVSLTPLN